jgi:hypothetical protein
MSKTQKKSAKAADALLDDLVNSYSVNYPSLREKAKELLIKGIEADKHVQ